MKPMKKPWEDPRTLSAPNIVSALRGDTEEAIIILWMLEKYDCDGGCSFEVDLVELRKEYGISYEIQKKKLDKLLQAGIISKDEECYENSAFLKIEELRVYIHNRRWGIYE